MKNSSTRFPDLDRLRSLLDYDADTGRGGVMIQLEK